MEPIRLQHMIPTFPYFQLIRLASLVTDLGLTPGSYLDTYDPRSGKWEQHTISTVRVVEGQQRLLYRIRKSLFEGIAETDCLGLSEEVQSQSQPRESPALSPTLPGDDLPVKRPSKRSAPEPLTPATKVHIPNNYYMTSPVSLPSSSTTLVGSSATASPTHSFDTASDSHFPTPNLANPPSPKNGAYVQPPPFYATQPSDLPQYLANAQSTITTIPYHPHPPLKRWPNDYSVSELTAGFHAMETLIAQSPTGASLTQRAAFERVFGSRYVKSTVCRHRGVWRKAQGPLREQFEAMGSDERACWGEFVRRFEGRPSAKHPHQNNQSTSAGQSVLGPSMLPTAGVMRFQTGSSPGSHVISESGSGAEDAVQAPVITQREEGKSVDEGPIMDSLQKP
jgi:hypothetical protein